MGKISQSLFLVFMLFGFAFSAYPQDALTLEDAVARALKGNFDITIARLDQDIARRNNTWGQTSAVPSIGVSAGYNATINDQSENPTAFIQEKLEIQAVSYGADLNWTLFDGFGMFASKRQLELIESQSEGNAALVVENAVQGVTLAYYEVKMQQRRLEVLSDVIALSRDRLKYEEYKLDLGVGGTFEILQFRNAIITDSTNYLLQELALRNAVRNLNLFMGDDPETMWTFTSELSAPGINYTFEPIWDEVKNRNQSLRNQVINSMLAQQDLKLARSAMYPVLNFTAGITENDNVFRVRALDLGAQGATLNYFGAFTLNFNLFNGGRTRRAMQNARIREEIALLRQEDLELQVQADLRNALELYNAQLAICNLTGENVENQRIAMEIAQDRFQTGGINSFDFRSQQVALLNAEMMRIEALQNLLNTHTQLVRLRGGLVR